MSPSPAGAERLPPAAKDVFGAAITQAKRYAELLSGPGVERGLIGPQEAAVIWSRHLLNCAVVADLIEPGARVLDLGSGAGLPGIPIALARPDLSVLLVEPMARRCQFLTEVAADLRVARVEVVRARGEELAGKRRADVVVARAVAPLSRLVGIALPLLNRGGHLLAIKGRSAPDELASARDELRRLDARAEIVAVSVPGGAETTTVVRVVV